MIKKKTDEVVSSTDDRLEPLLFAYKVSIDIDDDKLIVLDHTAYKHLLLLIRCSPMY